MGNYTLVAYIGPLHIYKRDQRGKTIEECPQAQLYFEFHEILDWIQVSSRIRMYLRAEPTSLLSQWSR